MTLASKLSYYFSLQSLHCLTNLLYIQKSWLQSLHKSHLISTGKKQQANPYYWFLPYNLPDVWFVPFGVYYKSFFLFTGGKLIFATWALKSVFLRVSRSLAMSPVGKKFFKPWGIRLLWENILVLLAFVLRIKKVTIEYHDISRNKTEQERAIFKLTVLSLSYQTLSP